MNVTAGKIETSRERARQNEKEPETKRERTGQRGKYQDTMRKNIIRRKRMR